MYESISNKREGSQVSYGTTFKLYSFILNLNTYLTILLLRIFDKLLNFWEHLHKS